MNLNPLMQALKSVFSPPRKSIFGGPVELFYEKDGVRTLTASKPSNQVLYRGHDVNAAVMAGQRPPLNTMYIEFVKSGTVFTPASPAKSSYNYYNTLAANDAATSDFLRIPITMAPTFDTSDETRYVGNRVTISGAATGGSGVRSLRGGTGFTFEIGDLLVGGALVSAVDGTLSNDLVFARFYYNEANQRQRISGTNLVVSWPLTFEDP